MESSTYLPYTIVAVSSQSIDSRVEELQNHSTEIFQQIKPLRTGGWESAHYCSWPQEMIIRLEGRS